MPLITGKTKLLGVIGDPVEHSLSPVMHNAVIDHLNLNYIYVPFAVKPEDLRTAIAGLEAIGVVGFNLTIPHKQTIIPLLSTISETAQLVGAVNTVWRTETGWSGTNTDVHGFLAPLKRLNLPWSQVSPVILGNGGAARAVVVGCYEMGCRQISVVGRTKEKLDHFYQSWQNTPIQEALRVYLWEDLPQLVSKTQLLINTTPLGMSPHIDQSPVDLTVMKKLQPGAIAYDLIYTPNPTLFLKEAQQQGAIIIDGLEMLAQQGALALSIWIKQSVPVEIMSQSLRDYLNL
ncbi:shikimate 5-dehydrogenase [Gloeothece citriformis PCC 7424]|uniref:Shikimate dehydrogenase (NADP(+)) n=1 Tax=Gloeothece citriformis (strain PCC 7424) TaxID=65393 RepID=AROE_GLOC7|nr:shikimate dehydrogenase [Gloeothece citriformis]B7KFV3.1 RecName: Full=Shikimate dehydrogenase (NADP(+)); Short=SDH [Gloeothece citriformis PCC 7424]ACK69146.1 shikimate 5-dehydrogenase [Gloeothece citriformis PCC 7424]